MNLFVKSASFFSQIMSELLDHKRENKLIGFDVTATAVNMDENCLPSSLLCVCHTVWFSPQDTSPILLGTIKPTSMTAQQSNKWARAEFSSSMPPDCVFNTAYGGDHSHRHAQKFACWETDI